MSLSQAPTIQETSEQSAIRHARRNAWIVTGYAVSGLVMLGVIFYSVAQYVAH